MDDEEIGSEQENENSTLRELFEEFIGSDDVVQPKRKEVSEEIKRLSEKVLRRIDRMLRMRRAIFFDNGYPYNRRFHREEFWQFAKDEFSDGELERGEDYNEVLDYLVDEGYLLFNERASDPMFDVFQVVPV
tara:strand:+ start:507 stop:902 length:396 start_codon:yes stop_codon:yes gene_type:complete